MAHYRRRFEPSFLSHFRRRFSFPPSIIRTPPRRATVLIRKSSGRRGSHNGLLPCSLVARRSSALGRLRRQRRRGDHYRIRRRIHHSPLFGLASGYRRRGNNCFGGVRKRLPLRASYRGGDRRSGIRRRRDRGWATALGIARRELLRAMRNRHGPDLLPRTNSHVYRLDAKRGRRRRQGQFHGDRSFDSRAAVVSFPYDVDLEGRRCDRQSILGARCRQRRPSFQILACTGTSRVSKTVLASGRRGGGVAIKRTNFWWRRPGRMPSDSADGAAAL